MITALNYVQNKVTGQYHPAQYPGEKLEEWVLPEDIRTEYARLNSMIETKYSREYLKICAFYNKLFPSLRHSGYMTSTYNVPPFTTMDQERADTGTGISSNYLKQIVDQIVSRIGTITFEPELVAEVPTLEYIVYKDEVERMMRKMIRDTKLNKMCMDVFHDTAIIGFSHVFIDPVTHVPTKANDYEIGVFESQFTADDVKQMLYRNYRFPTASLVPYIKDLDEEMQAELVEELGDRDWCDFKLYFDCPGKRAVLTINGKTLPDIIYPFDQVQMVTFCWDIGFSKVTSTSLFDLLYPTQRELNRVNAKIQQLIRLYKGSVPVFNSDVDLAMKAISNGTGEALYVDSSRPIDTLMTVINPTPIDAQLSATKTELKTEMYELAGLQQVSFDMENMRSAASIIAIDQTRDTVFQAQMFGMASFVSDLFKMQVHYNSVVRDNENPSISWSDVDALITSTRVDLKPVIVTSPLGTKMEALGAEPNYVEMGMARALIKVIRGQLTYDTLLYAIDKDQLTVMAAMMVVKINALNMEVPDTLHQFMIDAFIDDIATGKMQI